MTLAHAFVLLLGSLAATAALSWRRSPDIARMTLAATVAGLAAAAGVYLWILLVVHGYTGHLARDDYGAPVVFSLLCGLPAGLATAVQSKRWLHAQQTRVGSTVQFRWARSAAPLCVLLLFLSEFDVVMNSRYLHILRWFGRWCVGVPASQCEEVGVPERIAINFEYLLPWFAGHLLLLSVACVLVGRGVAEAFANRATGFALMRPQNGSRPSDPRPTAPA